jgi:peptidoglycan/LPS O-acetylase OafA/YrhL
VPGAPEDAVGGSSRFGYVPPLDGIRAFAVLAVMAYHGGVGWEQGGFLGVDAFFVLSGFLITSLLVDEWRGTGSIGLGAFWARRARRLLPALLLLLGAVALYGAYLAPADTLHGLRLDALFTLGYSANWHQVLAGHDYFAQSALPSPLLHTWSLAIEEQFYLVWPPVVLAVLGWKGRELGRGARFGEAGRRASRFLLRIALAGAVASAVEMALLYHPGGDPTRVYYGTDTRAQSILVGAALALLLGNRTRAIPRAGRGGLVVAAVLGSCFVGWMWTDATGSTPWLYRGGFLLGALCVAALIACVSLLPRSAPSRVLSLSPLRFVGRISYGLYLWHWPIYLVLDSTRTGLVGYELLAVRVAASFAAASASYYLLERPVRRGALRAWRSWAATPLAAGGACAAVLVATAGAAGGAVPVTAAGTLAPHSLASSSLPSSQGQDASSAGGASAGGAPGGGPSGPPVKLMLVGDSVALTLGQGMSLDGPRYGVDVMDKAILGCGLATGGEIYGTGAVTSQDPSCVNWPSIWASDVTQYDPDVVAVLVGAWEVQDWFRDGRWEHIGDPDFDAYELQQMQRAVDVLSAKGARVAFLTSPYYDHGEQPNGEPWPEDAPWRVDRLNKLMGEVAAQNPGVVSVVPLGAMLSPGGRYSTVVDGVTARWSDGVHITIPGGEYVGRFVLPQLAAMGRDRATGP